MTSHMGKTNNTLVLVLMDGIERVITTFHSLPNSIPFPNSILSKYDLRIQNGKRILNVLHYIPEKTCPTTSQKAMIQGSRT